MWNRSSGSGATGSEVELLEALRALECVLCAPSLGERARQILRSAVGVLHDELGRAGPGFRAVRGGR